MIDDVPEEVADALDESMLARLSADDRAARRIAHEQRRDRCECGRRHPCVVHGPRRTDHE